MRKGRPAKTGDGYPARLMADWNDQRAVFLKCKIAEMNIVAQDRNHADGWVIFCCDGECLVLTNPSKRGCNGSP